VLLYFCGVEMGDDEEGTVERRLGIFEDLDCEAHAKDMTKGWECLGW